MCGITGYLTLDTRPQLRADATLRAMTDAIRHRGPDSSGGWRDEGKGVGLGMRRLAIVDLSPAGAQPMISASGRYVLVFNGEIYNHKRMRAQLEDEHCAPNWRGHSDTEVLLTAIDAWGLVRALQESNGMLALALWDRHASTLALACDRFGEKPLYYGRMGNNFLFGSELKSLAAHPAWTGEIDRNALELFMQFSYVPAPHSIFCNVRKLAPGMIATLSFGGGSVATPFEPKIAPYWTAHEMVDTARHSPISNGEALEEFEQLFRDAVGLRMEADVPLGAFLSGGFDSTAVVAMMQSQASQPVRTFSIGFSEARYDEAPFAHQVAKHLKTEHTQLYVTAKQAMGVIPQLPRLYDEPFADSSQIPTFLVSQLARRHVTVALSGDGGDELFGGYLRYVFANRILQWQSALPSFLRNAAASTIKAVGSQGWDQLYNVFTLGKAKRLVGDRALKLAALLSSETALHGYDKLVTAWPASSNIVLGERRDRHSHPPIPHGLNIVEAMMFWDLVSYLPGDILTKVDRATMGVSLEGRIPFLDHRLAEFAWRLPLSRKIGGGISKRIVKEFVYRHVPRALMDRPKAGFGAPIGDWLRGPLRDWAESLLNRDRIVAGGYFDATLVSEHWQQHLDGRRNWDVRLWPLLMFQAWLDEQARSMSPRRPASDQIAAAQ